MSRRRRRAASPAIVDPNVFERAASYISVADLIDLTPTRTRTLASVASPDRKENP